MPSYEFRCLTCEKEFTVKIPYSQKSEVRCPDCGGADLKELFGRYHFIAPGVGAPDVEKATGRNGNGRSSSGEKVASSSGCSCGSGTCSCAD